MFPERCTRDRQPARWPGFPRDRGDVGVARTADLSPLRDCATFMPAPAVQQARLDGLPAGDPASGGVWEGISA